MEAKITVETKFDESMIVQEIHGASYGESLVKSVIRLKEDGARKALAELGYMEPAEAKALRARVAELEARAAVVPERAAWLTIDEMANALVLEFGEPLEAAKGFAKAIANASVAKGARAIPADRVLGDGMAEVPMELLERLYSFVGDSPNMISAMQFQAEISDALRANQGGAAR